MIRDTVTLDADPELFLDKIIDDIYFSAHILGVLLGYLRENDRLIARDELLEDLSELEWQFFRVINEILDHDGKLYIREISSICEKLIIMKDNSLERQRILEELSVNGNAGAETPIVSSEELTELLKAF